MAASPNGTNQHKRSTNEQHSSGDHFPPWGANFTEVSNPGFALFYDMLLL